MNYDTVYAKVGHVITFIVIFTLGKSYRIAV